MNCLPIATGFAFVLLVIADAMAAESRDDKTNEPRTIPLSAIVTTSPQMGLQHVRDAWQQANYKQNPEVFLRQIHDVTNGGSNVFLVDATNLHDALLASFSALVGSRAADTPATVDTPNPTRGSHWMVAYLGSGPSNPTWWTIESITVDKHKVVLSYRKSKPRPATDDVRRYYYWIPLGKLDPDAYELQLVDADKAAVTLMRRVEVTPTKEREGEK